jgi:hypothetical protein
MNADRFNGAAASPVLSGRELGIAVLEALGLSSKDVTAVTLQMAASGPATVSVSLVVRQPFLGFIKDGLAQFELVPRSGERRDAFGWRADPAAVPPDVETRVFASSEVSEHFSVSADQSPLVGQPRSAPPCEEESAPVRAPELP